MNEIPPVGTIYNIVEATARLRVSRRKLTDLIAAYPFYSLNGRRKLFSEDDIARLWNAMRQPVRDRHPFFDFEQGQPALSASPGTDAMEAIEKMVRREKAERKARSLERRR